MDTMPDIMVHGIPNVPNSKRILIEELNKYSGRLGPIRTVVLGPSRNFHKTNFAFVRYENPAIHQEAVKFLNEQGVPGTEIWFELNKKPTQPHHMLQDTPATPRVVNQLEQIREAQNERPREAEFIPIAELSPLPKAKSHNFSTGSCVVCMDDFSNVISVVSTQCGHLFCEPCLRRWVKAEQRSCPQCRTRLGRNYYSRLHY
ncbi:E3 ubiquitin- ligase RNF4 [Brachionus plicatilis]|uniref:E3 ubiquitin-ligase RNF4 n=1 Tax=Brachionus plicatilis TaxID=10195 RepID=A0A3M7T7R6_BRAPC|nr:E3 ubiquitin- ligase RNF4 [Brachionus plicatilis]